MNKFKEAQVLFYLFIYLFFLNWLPKEILNRLNEK